MDASRYTGRDPPRGWACPRCSGRHPGLSLIYKHTDSRAEPDPPGSPQVGTADEGAHGRAGGEQGGRMGRGDGGTGDGGQWGWCHKHLLSRRQTRSWGGRQQVAALPGNPRAGGRAEVTGCGPHRDSQVAPSLSVSLNRPQAGFEGQGHQGTGAAPDQGQRPQPCRRGVRVGGPSAGWPLRPPLDRP